jgi:hypothetical protein
MTVAELITRLQACNPESLVKVWDFGAGGLADALDVSEYEDDDGKAWMVAIEPGAAWTEDEADAAALRTDDAHESEGGAL